MLRGGKNCLLVLAIFHLGLTVFGKNASHCENTLGKRIGKRASSRQIQGNLQGKYQRKPTEVQEHALLEQSFPLPLDPFQMVVPHVIIEKYREGEFTTEISRVEIRPANRKTNPQGDFNLDSLFEMQSEAVEFALANYNRRDWNEDLYESFRKIARDYALFSTYIKVYKENSANNERELVGTLRLIRFGADKREAYYGKHFPGLSAVSQSERADWKHKIPMFEQLWQILPEQLPLERIFKVLLPRPMLAVTPEGNFSGIPESSFYLGEIIEPGCFAIKKEANAKVTREIFKHTVQAVFDPANSSEFNLHGKTFFTYGDESGKRLYQLIGFEPIPEKAGYNYKGVYWEILRATPSKLYKWARQIIRNKNLSEKEISEIREIVEALSRPPAWTREFMESMKMVGLSNNELPLLMERFFTPRERDLIAATASDKQLSQLPSEIRDAFKSQEELDKSLEVMRESFSRHLLERGRVDQNDEATSVAKEALPPDDFTLFLDYEKGLSLAHLKLRHKLKVSETALQKRLDTISKSVYEAYKERRPEDVRPP
jgi:hypothetical protein